jgi:hypothetical protein
MKIRIAKPDILFRFFVLFQIGHIASTSEGQNLACNHVASMCWNYERREHDRGREKQLFHVWPYAEDCWVS